MTHDALLTDAQLGELRRVAARGYTTPVTIRRRSVVADSDPYGDDLVQYATLGTVNGWLYSTPSRVADYDTGAVATINTYRLFLPVGTDILPGDQVVIGNEEFVVADTTAESTWNVTLTCSLRRKE